MNLSWGGSIPRVARLSRGEGEGSYPCGDVGCLRLACLFSLAARAPPEFARGLGQAVLSTFAVFLRKNGTIFRGGNAPRSSPRG
jgi:hypothetical protein